MAPFQHGEFHLAVTAKLMLMSLQETSWFRFLTEKMCLWLEKQTSVYLDHNLSVSHS